MKINLTRILQKHFRIHWTTWDNGIKYMSWNPQASDTQFYWVFDADGDFWLYLDEFVFDGMKSSSPNED